MPKLTKYIPWIPTEKQQAFLLLDSKEAFYGGAAGGAKSVGLLMAALQYVDVSGYDAILIRDTHSNLSKPKGLISLAHEWLQGTDARWRDGKYYEFPTDGKPATLSFGYLSGPLDHFQYQGPSYNFIGIDEIVQIRENQAMYLFSRLRKAEDLGVPSRFRAASNPPAREQVARGAWVKTRYVDPITRDKNVIFIPSFLSDNPYLDQKDYIDSLNKLDPITRAQLLKGDWEIKVSGRMFKREWFPIVDNAPKYNVERIRFWDLAGTEKLKENDKPAFTAGCLISRTKDGLVFIEDMRREQLSPLHTEMLIRRTAELDGREVPIWMWQDPGQAGKSQISHYTRNVLKGFTFKGRVASKSKIVVWSPFASQGEAGNVLLVKGAWNGDFLEELDLLPDGYFKDQADAAGGGFEILSGINIPVRPRVSIVSADEKQELFKEKPKTRAGESIIEVWEGDVLVGYEKIGGGTVPKLPLQGAMGR